MEDDAVGGQQAIDQIVAPGQCSEHFRRREGNVQEEVDPTVELPVAQHLGHEHQVEIVDPDLRRSIPGSVYLGQHRVGEASIDLDVARMVLGPEGGRVDQPVEQRPESPVGEPVVVPFHLLFMKRNAE